MDWSHGFLQFLPQFMLRFASKVRKKNMYQKRDFASSNPTHLSWRWVGPLGLERSHWDMDLNESLNSFHLFQPGIWVICLQFIYITSSITILNRYDIPIIYLYLYHSIYYDNRYVCIIKCIYETYTDILLFAVSISFVPIQCHISYWTQWSSCHCHWKILR